MPGAQHSTPKATGFSRLKKSGWPSAAVTTARASCAISDAAATSHSAPQRTVATRSASSAATLAMRSAMLLGLWTVVKSWSALGSTSAGTRAPGKRVRVLAYMVSPLRHAPWPRAASQISLRAGAASTPSITSPRSTSAIETAQPGRPRTKSRVPSMGSTTHRRSDDMREIWSAVSSESHAASGASAPSVALRWASTSKSASHTGWPRSFPQWRNLPSAPFQSAIARWAASAAASASASRETSRPGNGHPVDPERGHVDAVAIFKIVRRHQPGEHFDKIAGDGDFGDGGTHAAVLDQKAGRTPAIVAGHRVDAMTDQFGHIDAVLDVAHEIARARLAGKHMHVAGACAGRFAT